MEIEVKDRQSLLDIALITTGSAENALAIAIANEISITDELSPGTILIIPNKENKTTQLYIVNNIIPATGIKEENKHQGIFDDTFDKTFE